MVLGFLRLLRGWTQGDLAKACGLNRKTIGRYESGETLPSRHEVERLAAAAGVSRTRLDALFTLFGRIVESSHRYGGSDPISVQDELAAGIAAEIAAEIEPEILMALSSSEPPS